MIFGFSDPHWFHGHDDGEEPRGVIKHSKRPFPNRTVMNETMWDNINRVVGPKDLLVCCGDWVHGVGRNDDYYIKCCREARHNIRCQNVWLVCGNHDRHWLPEFRGLFQSVYDFGLEMRFTPALCQKWDVSEYENELLVWCHYKLFTWRNSRRGTKHVYGHCHGSLEKKFPVRNSRDIGVDCINFTPQSLKDLWAYFATQEHLPLADHHPDD